MTPYELGKMAATKQAFLPLLAAGLGKVLPYAAMIGGPMVLEKLFGGGGQPAEAPGASSAPAAPGAKPYSPYNAPDFRHNEFLQAKIKNDPKMQFGGLNSGMANWMQSQQMGEGLRKHHFRQLYAPRW